MYYIHNVLIIFEEKDVHAILATVYSLYESRDITVH